MRILVTGGAGFIGRHLVKHLLTSGHTVGILDRRTDWPLSDGWGHYSENISIFHMDCRDLPSSKPIGDWDFCYHLASTVGVSNVLANPKECIENIIESTRTVLALGIPGMYFSTSEVYGKNTEPLSEDSACIIGGKKRWSYAAAKLCGEWLALAAGWKVVRLFNVIGPNQNPAYGAVVPKFLDCARYGAPIPVYGDGEQKRTFTSVYDVVQILDMLRDKKFNVVNVGSENTYSILDLATAVKYVTHTVGECPIQFRPYAEAYANGFEECPARIPDLTKLRSLIGDFKFRDLETSLKECLNAQQERKVRQFGQQAAVSGERGAEVLPDAGIPVRG